MLRFVGCFIRKTFLILHKNSKITILLFAKHCPKYSKYWLWRKPPSISFLASQNLSFLLCDTSLHRQQFLSLSFSLFFLLFCHCNVRVFFLVFRLRFDRFALRILQHRLNVLKHFQHRFSSTQNNTLALVLISDLLINCFQKNKKKKKQKCNYRTDIFPHLHLRIDGSVRNLHIDIEFKLFHHCRSLNLSQELPNKGREK